MQNSDSILSKLLAFQSRFAWFTWVSWITLSAPDTDVDRHPCRSCSTRHPGFSLPIIAYKLSSECAVSFSQKEDEILRLFDFKSERSAISRNLQLTVKITLDKGLIEIAIRLEHAKFNFALHLVNQGSDTNGPSNTRSLSGERICSSSAFAFSF